MLVIMTGVAVALVVYGPERDHIDLADAECWRILLTTFVIGLSLAGPFFVLGRRRDGRRLGAGGMLALTFGLGALVMLPPSAWGRFYLESNDRETIVCLWYIVPLFGVWYTVAMALGGRLGRYSFSSAVPWSERYGLFIALAATPLGAWMLWDMYVDVFF